MVENLKKLLLVIVPSIGRSSGAIPQRAENLPRQSCAYGSKPVSEVQDGHSDPASLFDYHGRRKYLNAEERERFAEAAAAFGVKIEALCLLLHFTGCRISEALALCPVHLDTAENIVILQTLKQRKRGVFRTVPVPSVLMRKLHVCCGDDDNVSIFGWHRSTAWEKVCAVFERAGISGPQATPRGTRHGFGIAGVSAGVPINLVQRWLGHSRLETTSIYLAITGPEERDYANRLWNGMP